MTAKEKQLVLVAMSNIRTSISEWTYYLKSDVISQREGLDSALEALELLTQAMGKKK